jgi:PAS domain S-box-containing protein
MNTLTASIVFALINTIILVIIYYYLYRQYGERALKVWTVSWLVYSLRFVVMLLAQKFGDHYSLLMAHQASSLISGILLLYGVYLYSDMKMPGYWTAGFIVCMAWSMSLPLAGQGYFAYTMPVSVFIGAIFLWTGIAFLKSRTAKSLGTVITGVAFIVWALHKLNNPLLRPFGDLAHWGYFISSTIIIFVAVGILVSYFEKVSFKLLSHEKALDSALLDSIRRETQITLLLEGARNILENRGFGETARFIFESCRKFTGATGGYVALLAKDEQFVELKFVDCEGLPVAVDNAQSMPVRGLCAEVFKTGRVEYDNSFSKGHCEEALPPGCPVMDNVMYAPLIVEGRPLGLIGLMNKADGFDDNDVQITKAFADLASIALMNGFSREMLESSESRFRTLVESMNDVVFTLDREQRHTGAYGRWGENYHVNLEHFLGKTAVELMGAGAGGIHAEMNSRALNGENVTYEWSTPGTGGAVVHMQTSLSPIRDSQGVITGVVGVGRDITRLKEAESCLEVSLHEKDLLLKEIHHRVKNNMQVISSL